jgi:DNA-binding CsgD family transcriptional regulator
VGLCEASSLEELGEIFRESLATLIHSDLYEIAVFNATDTARNPYLATPGGFSAEQRESMQSFLASGLDQHPVSAFSLSFGAESALRISDLISLPEWRTHPFYQIFNRPFGHDFELDLILSNVDTDGIAVLSLARGKRDYTRHEVELLNCLAEPMTRNLNRLLRSTSIPNGRLSSEKILQIFPILSYCEAGVLSWLTEGKSDAEIAAILGKSRLTISTQVKSVLNKLGVENRLCAAITVLRSCSEMPGEGLEPSRPCGQGILSPQRLPFRHPGQK